MVQRYNYGPLSVEKGHTRLLEMPPASLSDHISIRLIHFPFSADSPPHYEALSYAWRTSETPEDVLVHSKPQTPNLDPSHYQAQTSIAELVSKLSVTANLASALHHLRYEDKARMLCIDALCIDQRNFEERSAVVGRMSSIYSSAKRVIVFLGPSSDECHLVHKFIAQDGQQKPQARRPTTDSSVFDETFEKNELDTSFMAAYGADTRMAVQRWLARPWFGSLWIWQVVHPVLLRPVSQQDGCYSLVGSCHVHRLKDSEALLGPLSRPWNTEWRLNSDGQYSYWFVID